MKFYRRLYVGPSIRNVNKIKWKLLTGRGQLGIYLISLSCTSDQLDIFHCALLKQKYFDKKALQVVGIAEGREEAIFLVQQMLQDTMDAGMEADICKRPLPPGKEAADDSTSDNIKSNWMDFAWNPRTDLADSSDRFARPDPISGGRRLEGRKIHPGSRDMAVTSAVYLCHI